MGCVLGTQVLVRAWVPVDDGHVMFWAMSAPRLRQGAGSAGRANGLVTGGRPVAAAGGRTGDLDFLPDTTDWLGKCVFWESSHSSLPVTAVTTVAAANGVESGRMSSTFGSHRLDLDSVTGRGDYDCLHR